MIVVDSSAMVNVLVDAPADPELLELLADEELHAPALLDFEVASALRGHAMAGKLDQDALDVALNSYSDTRIRKHAMTPLLGHVLELRNNFTVHDASYVVLAQALVVAPLVTCDAKLQEAERFGVEVRLVA